MRDRRIAILVLAIVAATAWAAKGLVSPQEKAPNAEPRRAAANPAVDLGSMLTGTFEGSTPGNNLTAVLLGTLSQSTGTEFNTSMRVTGKYNESPIRQQGVIHLESRGQTVYLQYIPHFDPTVGTLTTDMLRFTPRELESACNFDMKPRGDGYVGETIGTTTCARAIQGAIGKWTFEVEPGSIRIRNSGTGETMRFKRTSK